MELQFRKTSCSCLERVVREMAAQEVTQEIRLTDGMPDIGRVLTAWGQMVLRGKEWRGDTVTVTGGVMVWVLYAPEDGTEPRCIDGWMPFQLRWEHLDSDREGPVRISPHLRFVDARTVSARKFMVRCGAAALAEALCPGQVLLYRPEELPEDIEVLRRTYPIRLPKEAGEKTFQMEEELNIPGNIPEQILSYTMRPEIMEQRVMANKAVFRGNGRLHMVYRCREGRIRTHDFEIPFSQYAELDGTYGGDAQADIWMGTTGLELDLDENSQLHFKCGLVAQYLVDDRELIELAEDAYSPCRPVRPQMESVVLPAVLDQWEETIGVIQTFPGQNGELVDVQFMPDYPRMRRNGEEITTEIPGSFQILFYGEDGTMQSGNARWEGAVTIPADQNSRIEPHIITTDQVRARPSADGFELESGIRMQLTATGESGMPMVSALEVGEITEPDPARPSLILCRPDEESLWELAKRCGSTVDAIKKANAIADEQIGKRLLLIPVR